MTPIVDPWEVLSALSGLDLSDSAVRRLRRSVDAQIADAKWTGPVSGYHLVLKLSLELDARGPDDQGNDGVICSGRHKDGYLTVEIAK